MQVGLSAISREANSMDDVTALTAAAAKLDTLLQAAKQAVVDSSGWIEFFPASANGLHFKPVIEAKGE